MPTTAGEFVARVQAIDPRVNAIVEEHLEDNENELLLHVLIFRLGREAVTAHVQGELDVRDSLLACMEWGLTTGDDYVQNAVSVSFVEDFGCGEPEDFIASWPDALLTELRRFQP